jgi:hypothetical protein
LQTKHNNPIVHGFLNCFEDLEHYRKRGKAKTYYDQEFTKTFGKEGLPGSSGVWIPKTGLCMSISSLKMKSSSGGHPGDAAFLSNDDKEPKVYVPNSTNSTVGGSTGNFSDNF